MKWGRKWGNLWGMDTIDPVRIYDFEEMPPTALVDWDAIQGNDIIYHVYVDGKYYDSTNATEMVVQFQDYGRHWVEIFIAGPGNIDEALDSFLTTIPGTRVKVTWSASSSSDIDHYNIYWKVGGDWVYLGRTKSTETCFITDILPDGTYEFRVDPVDSAGNQRTSSSTGTRIVQRYPNPPDNLEIESFEDGLATFSFVESTTAGVIGYRIYHNSGNGSDIDYDTVRGTVLAGNTNFVLSGMSAGVWKVGLRAYNANYEEDNVDVYDEFELGGSPLGILEERPNVPEAFSVIPTDAGTFECRCTYDAYQERGKAIGVRFYCNDGQGGAVDYTSPVATGTVPDHIQGEQAFFDIEATTTALVDGRTYIFVARAVTSTGRESNNSDQATGTADATDPADITNLSTVAVNYEECSELEY